MKIVITATEPNQIDISTLEKIGFIVDHWDIRYIIVFNNLPGHTLTGEFKWYEEVLDLEEVTKHIHKTFRELKELK